VKTFKFFTRIQQEGEKFDNFLAEIKKLSQTCDFGTMLDRMIQDKIVLGIRDKVLQERLLRKISIYKKQLITAERLKYPRIFTMSNAKPILKIWYKYCFVLECREKPESGRHFA